MPQIEFKGFYLKSFSRDVYTGGKAHFVGSLSMPVAKAMGWLNEAGVLEIADSMKKITMDGELHATSITIKNRDEDLAKFTAEIDITKAHSFVVTRKESEGQRGKSHKLDLSMTVNFADMKGCKGLEAYMLSAGDSKGTVTIRHEPKPVQEQIKTADDGQAALTEQVEEIRKKKTKT